MMREVIKLTVSLTVYLNSHHASRIDAKIAIDSSSSHFLTLLLCTYLLVWLQQHAHEMSSWPLKWKLSGILNTCFHHCSSTRRGDGYFPREWNKAIKQSKSLELSITCCMINNSIVTDDPVVPGVKTLHDIVAIRKPILGAPKWTKWDGEGEIDFFSFFEQVPHLLALLLPGQEIFPALLLPI